MYNIEAWRVKKGFQEQGYSQQDRRVDRCEQSKDTQWGRGPWSKGWGDSLMWSTCMYPTDKMESVQGGMAEDQDGQ